MDLHFLRISIILHPYLQGSYTVTLGFTIRALRWIHVLDPPRAHREAMRFFQGTPPELDLGMLLEARTFQWLLEILDGRSAT